MCLNISKLTSCLRRSKMTFCYFLNVCSFISILVQKDLKSDIAFLRYGNFIEDVITDWWKVDFEKKALKICESVQSIGIWQFIGQFWHENTVFAPNPSSNLKTKYWRFQSMWNLKIDYILRYFDFASALLKI